MLHACRHRFGTGPTSHARYPTFPRRLSIEVARYQPLGRQTSNQYEGIGLHMACICNFLDRVNSCMDTSVGRRVVALLGHILLVADMASDYLVAYTLYHRGSESFKLAAFLCIFPYFVLTFALARPAFRIQVAVCFVSLHIKCLMKSKFKRRSSPLPLPACIFSPLWFVCGVPLTIVGDFFVMGAFFCADNQNTSQYLFYERLRLIINAFFESVPQVGRPHLPATS